MRRLGRLTPEKLMRFLKSAFAALKKTLGSVSIGFRAGVAVLLLAALIVAPTAFYFTLSGGERGESRFNDGAAEVCAQIIGEYGIAKTEQADTQGELYRMAGLSFAREIDFNADGDSELLVAFRSANAYQVEAWGSSGGEFTRLYSHAANTAADPQLGSWISLYRHSGRVYIGELSLEDGETMQLLTLHGGEFTARRECEYDPVNDIYAINGEMNTPDFETVRLSNISAARAEVLLDSITAAVEGFGGVDTAAQEVAAQSGEQLMAAAYAQIVNDYVARYGRPQYDSTSRVCFATGLCVAELIDFDGDGTDELYTVYRYNKKVTGEDANGNYVQETEPEYKAEVFRWNGASAVKIYENDGVSQMQDPDSPDRFYILRKNGEKTGICRNTYTYSERTSRVWNATSRISELDENGSFSAVYLAEIRSNYGYNTYQLNGERVYRREFNANGYAVPYFCNEDDYDDEEFTVVYLQGASGRGSDIQSLITDTQSNIDSILSATDV